MALVGEVTGTSLREGGRGQTFLVGLRYAWSGRRVEPFVQGLVGGANLTRTFSRFGRSVEVESLFGAYQVGGGLDVGITERVAARFAVDYLTLHSDRLLSYGESGSSAGLARFTTAAVVRVPPPDADALAAPSAEIAAGYQGFKGLRRVPFPTGWFVSVGRPLSERVTIVAEVADAYIHDVTPMIFVDEQHWYTYLAGVRYAWRGQRLVPFVQALGGASVVHSREEALYEEPPRTFSYSQSYAALQVTGGVDVLVMRQVAARFAANSLTLYRGGGSVRILRFSTGVVFRMGSR